MPVRPAIPAHVGDVGAVVIAPAIVDLDGEPIDLTGAASLEMNVERPTTEASWPAVEHDALAGLVSYTTAAGDLSEEGLYRIQARATFGDGRELAGPVGTLRVSPALDGGA